MSAPIIRSSSSGSSSGSSSQPATKPDSESEASRLTRMKGLESTHAVHSIAFKLGPNGVADFECPSRNFHYLLLSNDDIDEQDHGIVHSGEALTILHVHNLATVEREFTVIWA